MLQNVRNRDKDEHRSTMCRACFCESKSRARRVAGVRAFRTVHGQGSEHHVR